MYAILFIIPSITYITISITIPSISTYHFSPTSIVSITNITTFIISTNHSTINTTTTSFIS